MKQRSPDAAMDGALCRHFAAATRAGLPLHEVAAILAQDPQIPPAGRTALAAMAGSLAAGQPLSTAMAQLPPSFAPPTAQWIAAAERQGALAPTLDALALDCEARNRGRTAMRAALTWPLTLASCIAVLFAIIATLVVPAFRDAYASFGSPLPGPTRLLFGAAGYATRLWWLWLPLIGLLAFGYASNRLPAVLVARVHALAGLPGFVGRWRLARFVSRLLDLLRAHPADATLQAAALDHLAATTETPALAAVASKLRAAIAGGSSLSDALAGQPLLPRRLSLFAQLGEKLRDPWATLEPLCAAAAMDQELALARLERGAMLLLYLLLGTAVGAIVIAVYLPIFRLGALV